jgi:hypothetical protein
MRKKNPVQDMQLIILVKRKHTSMIYSVNCLILDNGIKQVIN